MALETRNLNVGEVAVNLSDLTDSVLTGTYAVDSGDVDARSIILRAVAVRPYFLLEL